MAFTHIANYTRRSFLNVLVTGGAGYIGAHTCKWLDHLGHTPVTLDNLSFGHEYAVQWGPFIKGDIRDRALVEKTIKEYGIDAIIHFAALTLVGESVQHPLKYFDNNFVALFEFLRSVLNTNVRSLIFSSTCAVYGIPNQTPILETAATCPINPYGQSKLAAEHLIQSLSWSAGLKAVSLRYFNAAGADPERQIGEDHSPETHLIPLAVRAALDPDYELTIFGEDYATPDGTCIRDYIHVNDLARAHVEALNLAEQADFSYDAFNLGTGDGFSVREIVKEVQAVTGKTVKCRVGSRRSGDPDRLIADTAKVKDVLNWTPKYSSLRQIVQSAVAWHSR